MIVIVCHPVRRPLERRGWPRWAATTVVIAPAYVILAALAVMLVFAAAEFTSLAVGYADKLANTLSDLTVVVDELGSLPPFDPAALVSVATTAGNWVLGLLAAFFVILAYIIFMAADGSRYSRAQASVGEAARPTMQRFAAFNSGVQRYFVVNASFGAVVAAIDGLALWMLQVPAPVVWAILAFVTNFIPNIGFVLGVVPPAVLALIVGGWPLMLAVVAIYSVVNVTLQVLIQPKFISDAVNLSLTLSFFSVIFWTFIIGPLGAILAIPLTLMVRALVLEPDRDSRLLRWFSGDDDPAREPDPAASPSREANSSG